MAAVRRVRASKTQGKKSYPPTLVSPMDSLGWAARERAQNLGVVLAAAAGPLASIQPPSTAFMRPASFDTHSTRALAIQYSLLIDYFFFLLN